MVVAWCSVEFVRVTEWNESSVVVRGGVRVGPIESGVSSEPRKEGKWRCREGEADGLTHVRSNIRYAYARCVRAKLILWLYSANPGLVMELI